MDPDELADELQRAYDRCKMFPEYNPSGRMALIELRNLVPRAIDLLRAMGRRGKQLLPDYPDGVRDKASQALTQDASGSACSRSLPPTAVSGFNTDADLEAAWQRRVGALEVFDRIDIDGDTPEETMLWAIVDEASDFIFNATATTTHGLAIQLWLSLAYAIDDKVQYDAVHRRDLETLVANKAGLDSPALATIAALRSLTSMGRQKPHQRQPLRASASPA